MPPPSEPHTEPSLELLLRKVLLVSGIGLVVTAGFLFAWQHLHVLLLLFAGVLAGLCLDALTRLATAWTSLPRTWAFGLVVIVLSVMAALLLWLEWASISDEVDRLLERLPTAIDQLRHHLENTAWGRAALERGSGEQALADAEQALPQVGSLMSSMLGGLTSAFVVGFLAFYFAADPRLYLDGLLHLFPRRHRNRVREILGEVAERLRWWLAARLFSMTAVAAAVGIGLWLLGVPSAFMLALLAGLLDFIPLVGPVLAALPAMLLAATQQPILVLWVGLLYLGTQLVEGYVILPLIQHRAVALPPALTVSMILILGTLYGMLGVLLAAPLTAVGMVMIQRLYVDRLGAGHGG